MTLPRADLGEFLTTLHALDEPAPFSTFLERFRRQPGARMSILFEQRHRGRWTMPNALAKA